MQELNLSSNLTLDFESSKDLYIDQQNLDDSIASQNAQIDLNNGVVLINILADACIKAKQVERALKLIDIYSSRAKSCFKPDEITFNTLLKGCA